MNKTESPDNADAYNMVSFDRPKFERLCDAYTKAKMKGAHEFTFEGHDLLVAYAKYLIQYLEGKFKHPIQSKKQWIPHPQAAKSVIPKLRIKRSGNLTRQT